MRVHSFLFAPILLAACTAEPAPQPTATDAVGATDVAAAPAPSKEDDIKHFLLQEYSDAGTIKYALGWTDLDDDGSDEAIVHLVGPYFCGTGGCTTLVLAAAGPMWRKVGEISVSRTPVTVLKNATNGWKDLTVDVSGGGMPGGIALLKFDGSSYPSNPTVPPAETAEGHGDIVIAEEPTLLTAEPETPSGG